MVNDKYSLHAHHFEWDHWIAGLLFVNGYSVPIYAKVREMATLRRREKCGDI